MIRRLLILAFVLAVAGNSLAAVAPVVDGDGGCGGCCKAAHRNEPRVSPSKLCCLTECSQPGETQPTSPRGVLGSERNYKADAAVAVSLAAPLSGQSSRVLHSPARSIVQTTHIYLRTGTLLI
jgi:hypothetical protein